MTPATAVKTSWATTAPIQRHGSDPAAPNFRTRASRITRWLVALGTVAVLASGCTSTLTGSSSTPAPASLPSGCHADDDALHAIEYNAHKMSMSLWNGPISNLSGQWQALRQQLLADGVPGSTKVGAAFSDYLGRLDQCVKSGGK